MLRVDLVLRVVNGVLVAVIVHSICISNSLRISHRENGSFEMLSLQEEKLSNKLKECGLVAGESSPVVFCNSQGDVRCVVHGDSFTFLAFEDHLCQIEESLRNHCRVVVRGVLCLEPADLKKISVKGRQLVWTEQGIVHDADRTEKGLWLACESAGNSTGGRAHSSTTMLWFLILDSLMSSLFLSLRHRNPKRS